MIKIKSEREILLIKKASKILVETRALLKKHIKPGISTLELDKIAEEYIIKNDATPSFKGYEGFPNSICSSVNEVVIHGIPTKDKILKEGDIISIDLGVCYKGYHADSCYTFKVGNVTDEVYKLLEVTENSLYEGIKYAKEGKHVGDISNAIETFIKPYKYGIVKEYTGHGIGRDLHEDPYVPNYGSKGKGPILRRGMTICIEPMINLGTSKIKVLKDGWTVITKDKKPSAHFEMQVLITDNEPEILTPFDFEV